MYNAEMPNITSLTQPATQYTAGEEITLTVTAGVSDGGTLMYQWYSSNANDGTGLVQLPGATNPTYTWTSTAAEEGIQYYYVVVTNTNGDPGVTGEQIVSKTSNPVAIDVVVDAEMPVITSQPQSEQCLIGGTVTLTVVADAPTDGGALSYQWYSNSTNSNTGGTEISGEIGASYTPPTTATGTIYYYVEVTNDNPGATGEMIVTATSDAAEVTVASPTLTASSSSLSFASNAGSLPLTVTTNTTWTATASATWITVPPSGSNGTVTVSVAANTGGARSGTITFTYGGTPVVVNVTQAAYTAPATLTASPASLSFGAGAGLQNITVTANTTWTATASAAWINVSPGSGNSNGTVTVSVAANTGGARSGNVTFTYGGSPVVVNVTQAAATYTPPPTPPTPPTPPPVTTHLVTLNFSESAISVPETGTHDVIEGRDFTCTLKHPAGAIPTVQTDRMNGTETPEAVAAPDGSYSFTVPNVREAITVTVTFIAPTGIEGSMGDCAAWCEAGVLYVNTPEPCRIDLYTITGQRAFSAPKPAGEAAFNLTALPRGIYILRSDRGWTRKFRVNY
jgi:hypothetical protein